MTGFSVMVLCKTAQFKETTQNNYTGGESGPEAWRRPIAPSRRIVVNSSNNHILDNLLFHIGTTVLQHGFYSQGGYNEYAGNVVDGVSGYCFHLYKQVANIDASGDVVSGNKCYDGWAFAAVGGLDNQLNPGFAVGVPLTRYATFTNNLCQQRSGKSTTCQLLSGSVPIIASNNIFEDGCWAGGPTIDAGPGSLLVGNRFVLTNSSLSCWSAIRIGANSIVSGTVLSNWSGAGIVTNGPGSQISGVSASYATSGSATVMIKDSTTVLNNVSTVGNGSQPVTIGANLTGVQVTGVAIR